MTTAKQIKEEIERIKKIRLNLRGTGTQGQSFVIENKRYPIEYLEETKLSQYKSDLQQELSFLEKVEKNYKIGGLSLFYVQERINFIKKELEEIEYNRKFIYFT